MRHVSCRDIGNLSLFVTTLPLLLHRQLSAGLIRIQPRGKREYSSALSIGAAWRYMRSWPTPDNTVFYSTMAAVMRLRALRR